ncbi:MAG: CpaF family protein [Deltaproteobacteria bacterium]|nr:MAG: CpaF family protein [Deltaproteobacteria bacterium]
MNDHRLPHQASELDRPSLLSVLASEAASQIPANKERLANVDRDKRMKLLQSAANQVLQRVAAENEIVLDTAELAWTVELVLDELIGFGPIGRFLRDEQVDEIMVNGPREVWVEAKGKIHPTTVRFEDDNHVLEIIHRITDPLGRDINEKRPFVDARLPDGSRVNCIIPPLAIDGPSITIRKFKKDRITIDDLVKFGTLTQPMADFLAACVRGKLNIVISGGTGSGKTTTLNVLSNFVPDGERIVTIEDAAELQLQKRHVVRLEARPADLDGSGRVSIRDLVKNSLRMRPDRVIVGEIRGAEAFDMLQAMNTGHDGSLTTGHANTPRDMIRRIESMCMMADAGIPLVAIREQIASGVHLLIQQSRLPDGSRRLTHVTEIQGMEGQVVTLSDLFIFRYRGKGSDGRIFGQLEPTGMRPKFEEHLGHHGVRLDSSMFRHSN